jgi:hypothetical protein
VGTSSGLINELSSMGVADPEDIEGEAEEGVVVRGSFESRAHRLFSFPRHQLSTVNNNIFGIADNSRS